MRDATWTWTFTPRAADQFDGLDGHVQDRIVSKLDEVVESEWREPAEYLEPLTGGPFSKLRVGQFRLACALDHENGVLEVHRIEHRSGASTADDRPWRTPAVLDSKSKVGVGPSGEGSAFWNVPESR